MHSEGFVVRFLPATRDPWTGNFLPSFGQLTGIFAHPDDRRAVVVAGGQGYVVDIESACVTEEFGADLGEVFDVAEPRALVFAGYTSLDVITPTETWRSARVSWDGIANLRVRGTSVVGDGFDPLNDSWQAFDVDLSTHELTGGAYPKELP